MRTAIVTGSCGLVGAAVSHRLLREEWRVVGVDNNMRQVFFGAQGSTEEQGKRLVRHPNYFQAYYNDVRMGEHMLTLFEQNKPELVVHAAAQPSHDWAAKEPIVDFAVNAWGTMSVLEAARAWCPEAPFVFLSTNKVYGNRPNQMEVVETPSRYEWSPEGAGDLLQVGWGEDQSVDQCLHSLFGVSKLAADLAVQEYGQYFGMPTCCLRCGCLTGEGHSGVLQHGFLSYLLKLAILGLPYGVNGFKGKQVRDNLHADDVASFVVEFAKAPRVAEVYNLGGGYENSCSILEAAKLFEELTGDLMELKISDEVRLGDHRVYYSDLTKTKEHYPNWRVTKGLGEIFLEIIERWEKTYDRDPRRARRVGQDDPSPAAS